MRLTPFGPGTAAGPTVPLQAHERSWLRAAARHARRVYPGDIGELLGRELTAYAEFGYRFSVDALVPRLATQILAIPTDEGPEITSIADRRLSRGPEEAEAS